MIKRWKNKQPVDFSQETFTVAKQMFMESELYQDPLFNMAAGQLKTKLGDLSLNHRK